MNDLSKLTIAVLLEQLGQHRRYRDRITKAQGFGAYMRRHGELIGALIDRGVTPPQNDTTEAALQPCRLRPLADHVVVLPHEAETLSEGGIVIPETAKEKPRTGEVLAVGPGRTEPGIGTILPAVSIGDEVLFGLYSGISFELDGQAVLIMREEDVLGVLLPKASE